ncbi:hypothetical protein OROMI_024104 [Orobanche minor]
MATTVLESCEVEPPQGAVAEQSLLLTFFNINWLHFHPMIQLLFYDLPRSKPHFLETVIPKLRKYLSLTLKHFFPLSGHVVYHSSPEEMPIYRYVSGDSVPVTVSKSSDEFDDLIGVYAKLVDKLYSFIPQLRPSVEESKRKLLKVLAVQVTLFPGRCVCIGITTHHYVCDKPSFLAFLTSWSAVSKLGGGDGDGEFVIKPIFDRSLINYPLKLDTIYWKNAQRIVEVFSGPTSCRSIY